MNKEDCNDPCIDPNCHDAGDYGFGLHCHHDHRDAETKATQDAFTERLLRREQAIEWLTDNLHKIQNSLRKNTE